MCNLEVPFAPFDLGLKVINGIIISLNQLVNNNYD